jgi:hypothetical protein
MKVELTESTFCDLWKRVGRFDAWSLSGLKALYAYMDEYFDENFEVDVIQLDSEFTEYGDLDEANEDLGAQCATLEELCAEKDLIAIATGYDGEKFIVSY